jgi:hypothetical protein
MNNRLITSIVLLFLIAVAPFWIYIPALALAAALFPFYVEAVGFGFLIDVLYGTHGQSGISLVFPFALYACALVLLLLPVKERLRIN